MNTLSYFEKMFEIRKITAEMTYDLRHIVLRPHQSVEDCKANTDYEDSTFHIGAFYQDKLVSVASFCTEVYPDFDAEKQYRLRGMATLEEFRNLGAGSAVINYAVKQLKDQGIKLLWCKGRAAARGYYNKLGFKSHGQVFDYPPTGPHIIMFKIME